MPPEYDVHVARIDELSTRTSYALWQLRESVFVVEQRCAYLELDGRDLEPGTRHLWVEDEQGPVGYLRCLDDDGSARLGRVLVAPRHRSRGVAELLVRTALELVGNATVVLNAQSHLAGWYTRFGFVPAGEEFVEDGIPHMPMTRAAQR